MPSSSLPERVRDSIRARGILRPGDRVLVACSGGPDSICLLHVLLCLRESWNLSLEVAHFNHRLRSGADEDERFVREAAAGLGLPFLSGAGDTSGLARERRINLEEAGRELRYAFLKGKAAETGADKIATGHTRTDQAETVLMHLLRGGGPRGLSGIPPAGEEGVVRPLLDVSRADVLAFLNEAGLPFRTDPSNRDRRFLRNRIRLELLPLLETSYAPGIERRLARLADLMRDEDAWAEKRVREEAAGLLAGEGPGLRFDLEGSVRYPRALRRRLVREFFRRLRGNLRGVTFADVENALGLERGREFRLRGGFRLHNQGGRLMVRPDTFQPAVYSRSWNGRDPLAVPEAGLLLRGQRLAMKDLPRPEYDDTRTVYLDWARLRFPLGVRSRRPGDRYRPVGAPGRVRLKELFRSRGVPVWLRDRRPVLVSGGEIVWAAGCPAAEAFKLTAASEEVLRVSVEPLDKAGDPSL